MKAFNGSYVVTVPLYFAAAFAGYLTFGRDVSSNVLVSISSNSDSDAISAIISTAQILVVIHVIIAFQVCEAL